MPVILVIKVSEFLSLISKNICNSNLEKIKSSPVISLMIDETTDISTSKQLIVYSCYLCCPKDENNIPLSGIAVWTRYLGMAEIGHTDAPGIAW